MFPEGGENPSLSFAATFATCSSIASRTGRFQVGDEAIGHGRWYRRPSGAYSGCRSRAANSFGASSGCSPGRRAAAAEVAGRMGTRFLFR